MLVSIVTPSRNQARYIEQTIFSVKGQDYPHIEHIIVDGASDDGTVDIIRRYENQYSLRWTSEPDSGQSDALNKGFLRAGGEVVGWLNSDDTYMPGAVSLAVDYLARNPAVGWVYGDGYWIDEHGAILGLWRSQAFDLNELVCTRQYVVQPTLFVRKRLLDAVGPVDTTLHYTMDTDLLIRLALKSPGGYIPSVMATRRLHPEAKTVADLDRFTSDRLAVLEKTFRRDDLPESLRRRERLALRNVYMAAGCRAFNAGQHGDARKWLWRTLRQMPDPRRIQTWKALAILAESYAGVSWYSPGRSGRAKARAVPEAGRSVVWSPDGVCG